MSAGLIIVWSVLGFFVVWLVTFTIKSHIEAKRRIASFWIRRSSPSSFLPQRRWARSSLNESFLLTLSTECDILLIAVDVSNLMDCPAFLLGIYRIRCSLQMTIASFWIRWSNRSSFCLSGFSFAPVDLISSL